MVDEQTWRACMDSEIFCNYLAGEINKEARADIIKEQERIAAFEARIDEETKAAKAFDELNEKIKSNPELLNYYRRVKSALINDPELKKSTDSVFVESIMMLDLGEY